MELSERIIIYDEIVVKNGVDSQMEMVIEEAAELIVAIRHFMRGRVGVSAVIEEIADMEIMLEQMMIIFSADDIQEIKQEKLVRLAKRMGVGKYNIELKGEVKK